jgi:hypothetical protein
VDRGAGRAGNGGHGWPFKKMIQLPYCIRYLSEHYMEKYHSIRDKKAGTKT